MRLFVNLQYNGRFFHGFQYQHGVRTVQGEIEAVLTKMHKTFTRIHPASRTDRGVHALEQCIHFDTEIAIPVSRWKFVLNRHLPQDMLVTEVKEIPKTFHVRYNTAGKTYRYKIYTSKERNPFYIGLKTHHPHALNEDEMRQAIQPFIGTHDFTSFSSAKGTAKDKVRTITQFDLVETGDGYDFVITGSGFLYNMVRIMVAYVLEVGEGKRKVKTLDIIRHKDRTLVPRTAPAEGLYLERIYYDKME